MISVEKNLLQLHNFIVQTRQHLFLSVTAKTQLDLEIIAFLCFTGIHVYRFRH